MFLLNNGSTSNIKCFSLFGYFLLGVAVLTLAVNIVKCQGKDETEGENRPYEFGFNIEGYQHRHEKKDEKGIIMGEFGFVTGDGVYHITVYATDENGNFKIVKMKNIFIGLPTDKPPTDGPETGLLMPIKVSEMMTNQLEDKKPEGIAGCGGCIIPIKTESEMVVKPPPIAGSVDDMKKPVIESAEPVSPLTKPFMEVAKPIMHVSKPSRPPGKPMQPLRPMVPAPFMVTSTGAEEEHTMLSTLEPTTVTDGVDQESAMTLSTPMEGTLSEKPGMSAPIMNINAMGSHDKKPKPLPPSIVMQMINTMKEHGKNENREKPPMKKPQAMLTQEDLLGMLYKYNYTLSYHGHHEIGNKKGDRSGGYFSNGRDGVGVHVKYKANEFGYQPNITFKKLSEHETPKKETEKINNKLHGYEFKWFYSR